MLQYRFTLEQAGRAFLMAAALLVAPLAYAPAQAAAMQSAPTPVEADAAAITAEPQRILIVGDSLSAEYGLARGSGWVQLLEDRLRQQGMDHQVINASVSGETTSGGLARLPGLLEEHQPDVVVIELGGNDGLRGLQLGASHANLREMARASREAGAQVVVVGMQIPPNYGRVYAQRFESMFATVAEEEDAVLVPFLLAGMEADPAMFQSDRIHPTAAAQPILLENVWPVLYETLQAAKDEQTADH